MVNPLTVRRLGPGFYQSRDGKHTICREFSMKYGRNIWYVTSPGEQSQWFPTLVEARRVVRDRK